MNIPLGVVAVAFTVGLPLWTILKVPEDGAAYVRAVEESRPAMEPDRRRVDQVTPVAEVA